MTDQVQKQDLGRALCGIPSSDVRSRWGWCPGEVPSGTLEYRVTMSIDHGWCMYSASTWNRREFVLFEDISGLGFTVWVSFPFDVSGMIWLAAVAPQLARDQRTPSSLSRPRWGTEFAELHHQATWCATRGKLRSRLGEPHGLLS